MIIVDRFFTVLVGKLHHERIAKMVIETIHIIGTGWVYLRLVWHLEAFSKVINFGNLAILDFDRWLWLPLLSYTAKCSEHPILTIVFLFA